VPSKPAIVCALTVNTIGDRRMSHFYWFEVYVFLNALMLTLLALNISRLRITEKVANGDGGKLVLKQAIRTHMNGIEHVLMYGLVILALSFAAPPKALMATLVIGFTLSRLVHAMGMMTTLFQARRIGAGVTYLFEVGAILAILPYGILR
jgi:uncharacterized membrane protein YecN with MAPEG domain